MRLATIRLSGRETAAVVEEGGLLPVEELNESAGTDWPDKLFALVKGGKLGDFARWYGEQEDPPPPTVSFEEADYAPPYRRPRKIWGIGLNYREHASDLDEVSPEEEPASFMKPDTAIIGPGEGIVLPRQSERVTAEAELGVVIGRRCRDVSPEDALPVVAGFVPVLDMTAEDILRRNPRYLTRAKSFDTFFSFGPHLVTTDEVDDLPGLRVATVRGDERRENVVANMTFSPERLVSFHSGVMTLLPGDIISTGTPGAVVIRDGDVVRCEVSGFAALTNPVESGR